MTVATGDDGSAERMGALVRGQREKLELSLGKLAARSGVSAATLSKLERGQRSVTLDLADRVLEVMGLRLHVTVEPLWTTVDEAIANAAGHSPAERVAQWRDADDRCRRLPDPPAGRPVRDRRDDGCRAPGRASSGHEDRDRRAR